jgi:hypothetical protein
VEATKHILPLLVKEVKTGKNGKKPNWRCDTAQFVQKHPTRSLPKGVGTFSAGWFAQGHEVSLVSSTSTNCKLIVPPSLLNTS